MIVLTRLLSLLKFAGFWSLKPFSEILSSASVVNSLHFFVMPRFFPVCALAALLFCASSARCDSPVPASKRTVSGVMSASTRAFRQLGFLGADASVVRARVLPPVPARKMARSNRVATADGSLLFVYKGFTTKQRETLSKFVSANYGAMVARYGAPSPEQRASGGKTIEVIGDQFAAAYQPLKNPDNAPRGDGGTIYYRYMDDKSPETNQFNFTRLILRAFQGPNNFSYNYLQGKYNDIYQAGLADAVSLLVLYDSLSAARQKSFNPADYGFTYLLHVYDLLNRPELSGAYIFQPNGDPDGSLLPDFRLGMAQAAWLKVAIENPRFFRDFNAAYYDQIPARQAVSSNRLRAIAAQAAPRVEGLAFPDWARRQGILDNAVTPGTKILPLVVPVATPAGGSLDTGFVGFAEAFATDSGGNDTRLTGYGRIEAFDENGVPLNAKWVNQANGSTRVSTSDLLDLQENRGNSADFEAGFSNFASPNRARLTLKLSFKGAQSSAIFPFVGTTGGAASQTTIYGVSQNGDSGSILINNSAGNETVSLSRGAFAGTQKYLSGPNVSTTLTLGGRAFVRNTAWLPPGARGVAFVLDGAARNDSFTLQTASGASKVRMISLPIFPTQSDEAAILGIAALELKDHLARYRPNLAPATVNGNVLTFGIGADRHELYPNISVPIAPGRGYWLEKGAITRVVQGSEPSRDRPFEIALSGGWNQFGVPFNRSFSPDAIRVRYGSFAPVSYADAVKNGLVAPGIWRWQARGAYARVDGVAGATLPPFEGFYIYAIPARGVSLIFNPAAPASTNRTASAANGWSVPLVASTDSARDASNRFGVSNAVVAAAKPPTGPAVVTLHFVSSGNAATDQSGAGSASGWADSFLASLGRAGKWELSVEGTRKGESVALSWGDLKGVPSDVKLTLRDQKAGKSVGLRAGGSYKWTSDGVARRFAIDAARSARATLQTSAAPSRGVQIALALSLAARGRLEIQNAAGDTIFSLKNGEFAATTEKFYWSGERNDGRRAALGRFRAIWIPALPGDQGAARDFDYRP